MLQFTTTRIQAWAFNNRTIATLILKQIPMITSNSSLLSSTSSQAFHQDETSNNNFPNNTGLLRLRLNTDKFLLTMVLLHQFQTINQLKECDLNLLKNRPSQLCKHTRATKLI